MAAINKGAGCLPVVEFFVTIVQRQLHILFYLVVNVILVHEPQVMLINLDAGYFANAMEAKVVFVFSGQGEGYIDKLFAHSGDVSKPDFGSQTNLGFGRMHLKVANLLVLINEVVKQLYYFRLSSFQKAFQRAVIARVILVFPGEAMVA
jgi:hypothetical protein